MRNTIHKKNTITSFLFFILRIMYVIYATVSKYKIEEFDFYIYTVVVYSCVLQRRTYKLSVSSISYKHSFEHTFV